MMQKRLIKAWGAILITVFALSFSSVQAAPISLTGYAWSDVPQEPGDGAGWIKFDGSNYGVSIESSTGALSGYAWSEHLGWLSFNSSDVSGCPSNPCNPSVNLGTGALTGWARFISAPAGTSGDWNGWVHLSGSNYGATMNLTSGAITGFSWGENIVGWVKWDGTGYGVSSTDPLVTATSTITVTVSPSNASYTINPGNIQRTGSSTIAVNPSSGGTSYTITPGSTPPGFEGPPTITNSQGGGSSAVLFPDSSVSFDIAYIQPFNYTLSNGGAINIQKGGGSYVAYGQTTITRTLTAESGPTQQVDISVGSLPSGVSVYTISGNPCSPNCSSTVTLAVSSGATSGTYPITVTGAPLSKTTNFNLNITDSPDLFVTCSATPPVSAKVGDSVLWTALVSQTPSEAPYEYYWTGTNLATPAATSSSFSTSYSTTGNKSANVLVTDSKGNTAICNPPGSINIGVNPIFEEF